MQQRSRKRDAGIEQQRAKRPAGEAFRDRSTRRGKRRRVGHIGDQRGNSGAECGAERCRIFGAAHGCKDMPAFSGEARNKRMTDPSRSARDDDGAPSGVHYSAAVCFAFTP